MEKSGGKKEQWKEPDVITKKYQKKTIEVKKDSLKKPTKPPKQTLSKKPDLFANLFKSGSNPFLKQKLKKSLVATPSKFEIRHDNATKKVTKTPKKTGIRDKLKAIKSKQAP